MFLGQPINYTHSSLILGQHLVPPIDFRSAMTYKTLKANTDYVCRITICLLNPTELSCSEHKQLRNKFDAYVVESLDPVATISDFYYKEYTDLTPYLDYYNGFDEDGTKGSLDESPSLPSTSEVNDQYLNIDLVLHHGRYKARGHVTKQIQ